MHPGTEDFWIPSAITGSLAIGSLLLGKTPYAFFGAYFIAYRRRDPGHFWVSVGFDFAMSLIFALIAIS
jgi:hypothetical protein